METIQRLISWLAIGVLMTACNSAVAISEPDRIATSVAEARAVAATLTAGAPTMAPVPPTSASTRALPTAGPTLVPSTLEPTATVPRPPTLTNTPMPQRADPFVPGGGDPKGLLGKILLPGYASPPQAVDEPVFNQHITFRLFVYDLNLGQQDGAGINSVEIRITDPNGFEVYTNTERNPAYCAFSSNEPDCPAWKFAEHGNRWPNGTPVCRGQGYEATMTVDAHNDHNDGALWRFNFDIDGDYPPC